MRLRFRNGLLTLCVLTLLTTQGHSDVIVVPQEASSAFQTQALMPRILSSKHILRMASRVITPTFATLGSGSHLIPDMGMPFSRQATYIDFRELTLSESANVISRLKSPRRIVIEEVDHQKLGHMTVFTSMYLSALRLR